MHDKSTLIYDHGYASCIYEYYIGIICQPLTRQAIEYPSRKL